MNQWSKTDWLMDQYSKSTGSASLTSSFWPVPAWTWICPMHHHAQHGNPPAPKYGSGQNCFESTQPSQVSVQKRNSLKGLQSHEIISDLLPSARLGWSPWVHASEWSDMIMSAKFRSLFGKNMLPLHQTPQKWFYRRNVEYSQAFPLNQASMIWWTSIERRMRRV